MKDAEENRSEGRALLDSVRDYAIFMLDAEGRVRSWNAGACTIEGYAESEILGHSFTQFFTPEDLAAGKPQQLLERAATEGRAVDEGWRVRKDGTHFWADVVLTALVDADGVRRGFVEVTRDLTERRRAEELLRQSEQRMRLLVDSVRDYAIFMLDPEGRIATWNPGAERIKGYRAEEAIGRHMSMFYPPEDVRAGRPEGLLRLAATEGRALDEGWRVRKDGTHFWADVVISRVQDATGALIGFAKVTRDLTERRRHEEALRDSEERMRLMIESARDYAIFMLDPDGRVASWNAGAQRLKGYRAEEIIGRHFSTFYPQKDIEAGKPRRELEIAAAEGRFEDEGWRLRKDGSLFWANVVISAMRNPRGVLVGFNKVTRDMTERWRNEEALRARTRQQATIAELGLVALQTRDLQKVLECAVQLTEATLGVELVRVLELREGGASLVMRAGAGWDDGVTGEVMPADERSQEGFVLRAGDAVVMEEMAREERFVPSSFLLQHGAKSGIGVVIHSGGDDQQPYGILDVHSIRPRRYTVDETSFLQAVANVIATAISRRWVERQLQVAEHEAEVARQRTLRAQEAVRERDEFMSVAAHELRTPLTALQLKLQSIDAARRNSTGSADGGMGKIEARVEGALRQTERLTVLVERLLDVSRIAQGRLELMVEEFDLRDLVTQLVDDFGEQAASAHSEIRIDAPAQLLGQWDRGRLSQAFINVLANAIKYGRGKPVDVRLEGDSQQVRLTIRDHGIGIPPADRVRIFRRFERAAPLSNYGGLGLGLYITRHIVEAHGGTIDVRSEHGKGATFVIELPRRTGGSRTLQSGAHVE